jgi:hypothetical protein
MGYDIGCTFRGTAQRSPLVGPLVREQRFSFCVGSFHGYAHNRKCQLRNHPLNLEGAGAESFEECETLFSSTNSTALTTRHASAFHRRQLIVLHLSGWDLGRRCALGRSWNYCHYYLLLILADRFVTQGQIYACPPRSCCVAQGNRKAESKHDG